MRTSGAYNCSERELTSSLAGAEVRAAAAGAHLDRLYAGGDCPQQRGLRRAAERERRHSPEVEVATDLDVLCALLDRLHQLLRCRGDRDGGREDGGYGRSVQKRPRASAVVRVGRGGLRVWHFGSGCY